jgi:hypothetical protein
MMSIGEALARIWDLRCGRWQPRPYDHEERMQDEAEEIGRQRWARAMRQLGEDGFCSNWQDTL